MSLIFYPQDDDLESAKVDEKLETFLVAAERYKAAVLDKSPRAVGSEKKGALPKDISFSFNWDHLSKLMRKIREMPEVAPSARTDKAIKLEKLASVYEVLRGGKMSKLEAVRLALMGEMKQLRGE